MLLMKSDTLRLFFASVLLCFAIICQAAAELPATMMLYGGIEPGSGIHTISAATGDQVLAFSAADGMLVGSGPYAGGFVLMLVRTASFNGTPVVFELMQGLHRYQLLQNGKPAWLRFEGKLLPDRFYFPLQVGAKSADLLPEDAANPKAQRLSQHPDIPCTPALDVNADGRCDEADWGILGLYGGGVTRSVARP